MEYGAERKISRHSILGATVSVGVPQGVSLKIKSVKLITVMYLLHLCSTLHQGLPDVGVPDILANRAQRQ